MFLEVFLVGLLAGISPGPDFAVVLRNCLAAGRRAGTATALGIATALIIHVSYTILGFAIIMKQTPGLFRGIQILGAGYLIYLGIQGLRSGPAAPDDEKNSQNDAGIPKKHFLTGFREGFLCNLLNPKAPLFYLSIFAQFLTPQTPEWIRWIYGLETILAVGGWFVSLSYIITLSGFRSFYHKYRHWLDRALGLVLLYFALRIFGSALKLWDY